MGKMNIDLRNYKDTSGSRVPEGRYRVQVEFADESRTRTDKDMITLGLRIVGGEFEGQTIVDRLVITDKALFRVVGFLQALGIPTPKRNIEINTDRWVGRMLDVDVRDGEPYNGTIKSEVSGYSRVPKKAQADDFEDTESDDSEESSEEEESKKSAEKDGDDVSSDEVNLDEVDL